MTNAQRRRAAKAQAKAERLRAAGLAQETNGTRYVRLRKAVGA